MTPGFMVSLSLAAASATSEAVAQERRPREIGLTVFADGHFRGASATLRQDASNLGQHGLNDRISSLRVAPGEQWEVCEHRNFRGRCIVVSGDEPELRTNEWSDVISSARRLHDDDLQSSDSDESSEGDWYIVLYDQPRYRGRPTNYRDAVSDVGGQIRRVQSVAIRSGVWELCEGERFTGRCIALDVSVPDLATYGMRNRVMSVRPLTRYMRR
jgi:hypothetical protein